MQVHFNTDSIFFVCNNSTTGHICNDIWKFIPDTMQQTNNSLTTANGMEPCLQEGTVRIRLIDDAGTQHIFILDNCLYHPSSPVYLLLMRRLAEKFLNADGNPDEETDLHWILIFNSCSYPVFWAVQEDFSHSGIWSSAAPFWSQVADSANYRGVRWSGFTWRASSQYGFTPMVR